MSNDIYGGSGFNPDAPTADNSAYQNGGNTPMSNRSAQTGYNPDAPTAESGSDQGGWSNSPVQQYSARNIPAQPSYNPDAPTDDSGEAAGGWGNTPIQNNRSSAPAQSAPAPAQPFRKMSFNPDAPTDDSGAGQGGWGNAPVQNTPVQSAAGPSMPFKPMGGRRGNQTAQDTPVQNVPAQNPPARNTARREMPPPPPPVNRDSNSYHPRVEPDAISRTPKLRPDQHSYTLKEMQSMADQQYGAEMTRYQADLAKWKNRLWIPVALLVSLVVLILLAGAFAGGLGVVVMILAAGITIAILTASGKMNWLKKPKKPKKMMPEMATPEMNSVYSVRLRLKSMNLPKPVEVTIRKEEQLLGSDQVMCLHPLPYKGISHRHCMVISRNMHGHTTYLIRDEGSKNGTRLNDKKLEPGVEYPLQIGDVITLAGRYQFRVVSDAY